MSITLVMVAQVYMHAQTHQILYTKYADFCIYVKGQRKRKGKERGAEKKETKKTEGGRETSEAMNIGESPMCPELLCSFPPSP